ncbi:PEP-CTERM sorting domain-containing protein [Peristeroidobacter agariperforans]|uniref:PEP-CTERM sorting domain-containing protein n=1 Tax=Peristeroidobacter agariperforans TaxID=268404 RepID=UPI00101DFFDC|nr:PEP-CTERM sorting domain-containing protein [Peristeroidobacter agariperforans]
MSNKSWVAMTGLCVLMAASAAQAHPISVENVEAGAQARGAPPQARDWARALGRQSEVSGLISRVPLRPSDHGLGRNDRSIVDRICDEIPTTPPPPTTKVPEPETLALLMAGLLGVAVTRGRRKPAAEG